MQTTEGNSETKKPSWWSIVPWVITFSIGMKRFVRDQGGWITWAAISIGLAGIAYELWMRFRKPSSSDEDEPIRSLVFLLTEPREIEAEGQWIQQIGSAVGQQLNVAGEKSTEFIMPMPHPAISPEDGECFMLSIREGMFWILNMQKPYIPDTEDFAQKIPDARLRTAIAKHKAWISVDLVSCKGEFNRTAVYAVIGKVLSALAGPDVLAVFCPELQRCNEFDPSLLSMLASGEALSIFDGPTFAPVMRIDGQDEQLEAAKAEAKRRWPEFVAQFERSKPFEEAPFIVKAPFCDTEHTEFMWVEVVALDGELLSGTLANSPHQVVGFREGQSVTIPTDSVVDWICKGPDEKPLGGWTQEVLMRQSKSRK